MSVVTPGSEYDTIPARDILHRELSTYCENNALGSPPSQSVVGKQVKALNYGLGRDNGGRFYKGIKWKPGCEAKTISQLDHLYSNN